MAGRKEKLRYQEETPWFPEYNIGWIGIGNCGQKTSSIKALDKESVIVNTVEILWECPQLRPLTLLTSFD